MSAEQASESPPWPKSVTCGELIINIWHHTISGFLGQVDCWTYLSQGMSKAKQPELVVTLRRRPSELEQDYSLEPLEWFKMVFQWGKEGRIIDPYHTHEAHSEHWLGSKNLETITHGMPIEIPGFGKGFLPKNRLHGIALTSQEAVIAKAFGYTRVIGHYGLSERWFPYCIWIDRDREDYISMAQMEKSLRFKQVPIKKVRALSARWEGKRMILTIPHGRELEVKAAVEQTRPEEAWAFDSCLHPDADSCFYWQTGQKEMRVYGAGRKQYCKGLAFIIFCPQQSKDHWNILEDGATIFLRDPSWLSIRHALVNQQDISIPLGEDMTFCVEFIRDTYSDPVTGLVLRVKGQVRNWYPRKPGWLEKSHLQLDRIIVRDPPQPSPDHTADAGIIEYMELIGETLEDIIPKKDPGVGKRLIILGIELPGAEETNGFTFSVSPDEDGLDIKRIWSALLALPKMNVSEFTTFHMIFGIWGANLK